MNVCAGTWKETESSDLSLGNIRMVGGSASGVQRQGNPMGLVCGSEMTISTFSKVIKNKSGWAGPGSIALTLMVGSFSMKASLRAIVKGLESRPGIMVPSIEESSVII